MKKKFMIDLETTGVNLETSEILQIAALELNFDGHLWIPGNSINFFQHTDVKPASEFALKNMKALYDHCNAIPFTPVAEIRAKLLDFFRKCDAKPPTEVFLAGQNSIGFDVPLLVRDGYLEKNDYVQVDGKDVMVGDFHYRQFDLNPIIEFVEQLTKLDRKAVIEKAMLLGQGTFPAYEGAAHDGLYDCYAQTQLWNGLLMMLWPRATVGYGG